MKVKVKSTSNLKISRLCEDLKKLWSASMVKNTSIHSRFECYKLAIIYAHESTVICKLGVGLFNSKLYIAFNNKHCEKASL